MSSNQQRIGIFRGTFDPVHAGHIAFAVEAIKAAKLDHVYFLVEPGSLHKTPVADFRCRLIEVTSAVKPYESFDVLDLGIANNQVAKIIPKLHSRFGSSVFIFLMGSDVAKAFPVWSDSDLEMLCDGNEIVVALRGNDKKENVMEIIDSLSVKPDRVTVVSAPLPGLSSSAVRQAKEVS